MVGEPTGQKLRKRECSDIQAGPSERRPGTDRVMLALVLAPKFLLLRRQLPKGWSLRIVDRPSLGCMLGAWEIRGLGAERSGRLWKTFASAGRAEVPPGLPRQDPAVVGGTAEATLIGYPHLPCPPCASCPPMYPRVPPHPMSPRGLGLVTHSTVQSYASFHQIDPNS